MPVMRDKHFWMIFRLPSEQKTQQNFFSQEISFQEVRSVPGKLTSSPPENHMHSITKLGTIFLQTRSSSHSYH